MCVICVAVSMDFFDVARWLAPLLATALVLALWRTESPGQAASLALTTGFVVGYALLPGIVVSPNRGWHWLPFIAILVTLSGPLVSCRRVIAWPTCLAVSLSAALLLVPDWQSIAPLRHWHVAILTCILFLVWILLLPRIDGAAVPCLSLWLGVVAIAGALVLLQAGIARFAMVAGILAACMFAVYGISFWAPDPPFRQSSNSPFIVVMSGLMFSGFMNSHSRVPWICYVLIPTAPLALWLYELPFLRPRDPKWQRRVQSTLIAVPLVLALGLAIAAEPPWSIKQGDW